MHALPGPALPVAPRQQREVEVEERGDGGGSGVATTRGSQKAICVLSVKTIGIPSKNRGDNGKHPLFTLFQNVLFHFNNTF